MQLSKRTHQLIAMQIQNLTKELLKPDHDLESLRRKSQTILDLIDNEMVIIRNADKLREEHKMLSVRLGEIEKSLQDGTISLTSSLRDTFADYREMVNRSKEIEDQLKRVGQWDAQSE